MPFDFEMARGGLEEGWAREEAGVEGWFGGGGHGFEGVGWEGFDGAWGHMRFGFRFLISFGGLGIR